MEATIPSTHPEAAPGLAFGLGSGGSDVLLQMDVHVGPTLRHGGVCDGVCVVKSAYASVVPDT